MLIGDSGERDPEIYAEIVRVAERANGQSAFQYYLRQRPRAEAIEKHRPAAHAARP